MNELSSDETLKKSSRDYRLQRRYEVYETNINGGEQKRMLKHKGTDLLYVSNDEIFDVIHTEHLSAGHGARDVSKNKVKERYANVTKETIQLYVDMCETCALKKRKVRKSLVVKPILSNTMNSRCQVDLIDLQTQPDGEFKFILNYQDHLTKFVVLRSLRSKRAPEVAYHVMDIFCLFGAPHILQSDNGREFANNVVKEILQMWPVSKLVHGKPRHSQSHGSVERANKDVEDILACWMRDNDSSKWSEGLRFVQYQKNGRLHSGIGRSPYQAMFGEQKYNDVRGLRLPDHVWAQLETEEHLSEALNEAASHQAQDLGVGEEGEEAEENLGHQRTEYEDILMENMEDEEIDVVIGNTCGICDVEYEGSTRCSTCATLCHDAEPCSLMEEDGGSSKVVCQSCTKENNIIEERNLARNKQQKQANRMISMTAKRFKTGEIGENVSVPVPDVDRGRGEFRNVLGVITEVDNDGMYAIGTAHGTLKQKYARSQFVPNKVTSLKVSDIPGKEVNLREVARKESMGSGQGFTRCGCFTGCSLKSRCTCLAAGLLCNSKCHKSLSCKNK